MTKRRNACRSWRRALLRLSSGSLGKLLALTWAFLFIVQPDCSGVHTDKQLRLKSLNTGSAPEVSAKKDHISAYVCVYDKEELQVSGFFGGRDYAASHLAIKCAIGAAAGSAVGSKFGGMLGAASGAAAGCYFLARGPGFLDDWVSSLDKYIDLTPAPLGMYNKHCSEREAGGEGPGNLCKEVK